MKDDIFWGNLLGILKLGKWNLSGDEMLAFAAVYEEAERRSKPPAPTVKEEPIKKAKNGPTGQ